MGTDYANEICNHFFQQCGATIGKKDYDYVVMILNEITKPFSEKLKKTEEELYNRTHNIGGTDSQDA
jgi:hypothetical protein